MNTSQRTTRTREKRKKPTNFHVYNSDGGSLRKAQSRQSGAPVSQATEFPLLLQGAGVALAKSPGLWGVSFPDSFTLSM